MLLSIKERIESLEKDIESLEKDIEELREATASDRFEEITKKLKMKEDIQKVLTLYREMEGGVRDV